MNKIIRFILSISCLACGLFWIEIGGIELLGILGITISAMLLWTVLNG